MFLLLALLLLGPGPAPAADIPAALTVRIEDPADPGSVMTFTVLRGTEIHLLPSGTVVVRIPGAWEVATGVPVPAPAERHAPVPDPVAPPAETAEPETPPLTEESLPPLPESLLGIEG